MINKESKFGPDSWLPSDVKEITDEEHQERIKAKALEMIEDWGNYTLMADVLDDLSDDYHYKELRDLAALQDACALGNYMLKVIMENFMQLAELKL